jgi:hypothetical protein
MQSARLAGVSLMFILHAFTASAQSASGRLEGVVRAAETDATLPYAVVSIPALKIERFADASGRFALGAVPAGKQDVVVRRIGFTPWRGAVQVIADSTTTLSIRLDQLPQRLDAVAVRAMARCEHPGPPDPALQREVSSLVAQLRENADRYRLLAQHYPFTYSQTRWLGEIRDSVFLVQRIDSTLLTSIARAQYKPGKLVERTRVRGREDEFTMAIPTLLDLSDDAFIGSHCFGYGGTLRVGAESWVRINMRAADRLKSPDVDGAFLLDSATSQLRRMELEMSKPERLPYQLRRVEGVHVTTTFREIAAGLSVIESVCAVNSLRAPLGTDPLPAPSELQQLRAYLFNGPPPPDVARSASFRNPTWTVGTTLRRDAVWCQP